MDMNRKILTILGLMVLGVPQKEEGELFIIPVIYIKIMNTTFLEILILLPKKKNLLMLSLVC
jgi:hypothetical protein